MTCRGMFRCEVQVQVQHQGGEGAQLLGEGEEHLVLVIDRVRQEGDQLRPRPADLFTIETSIYLPLDAEGEGDGGQLLDGVETKLRGIHLLVS